MIDASKAREIAERCLEEARAFWGIDPAWRVEIRLKRLEDGTPGNNQTIYDYLRSTIELDPSQWETEEEVWQDVAHEAAHLVLASYDLAFSLEAEPSKEREAVWRHANERATSILERVFLRERPYAR